MTLNDSTLCPYTNLYFTDGSAYKINSIVVGVINLFTAIPTIFLNILVCVAFARKATLRRNGNKVLFSLSLSDLLSGVLIQPVTAGMLIFGAIHHPLEIPCAMITFVSWCGHTLACVSLLTVSLISLERYLAIFHPYVYNRRISARFLFIMCSFLWSISIIGVFTLLFLHLNLPFYWVNTVIIVFTYVWNIFVYIRIVSQVKKVQKEVNRMRNRFQTNEQNGTVSGGGGGGGGGNGTNEKHSKGTQVAGAIIVSLLLTYFPQVVISVIRSNATTYQLFIDYYLEYWSFTFALLNPCLNPIFYCYYNTDIRREVKSLLCFRNKNQNKVIKSETGITNTNYSQSQENLSTMVEMKRDSVVSSNSDALNNNVKCDAT